MNTRDFQIKTVILGILNQPTFCVLGSLEYNFAIFVFINVFDLHCSLYNKNIYRHWLFIDKLTIFISYQELQGIFFLKNVNRLNAFSTPPVCGISKHAVYTMTAAVLIND